MDTLGKRIAAGRKKLGLTQDQLAEKLGITAQAVSKWENDLSCPDIATLPKLAELLGTTTDALLGREAAKPAEVVQTAPSKPGWDRRQKDLTIFGLLMLFMGSLVLARAVWEWDVSFWGLLWPAVLIVVGLRGLFDRLRLTWASCVILGGYFLLENTGLTDFDLGGELIVSGILLVIGISLLIDAIVYQKKAPAKKGSNKEFQMDGESFRYADSFGEGRQFISMNRLSSGTVSVSFGEHEVDLSGVNAVAEDCRIKASCSFGELTILVPRRFRAQCDGDSSFASIETVGQSAETVEGTILLDADCSFGSIQIRYI